MLCTFALEHPAHEIAVGSLLEHLQAGLSALHAVLLQRAYLQAVESVHAVKVNIGALERHPLAVLPQPSADQFEHGYPPGGEIAVQGGESRLQDALKHCLVLRGEEYAPPEVVGGALHEELQLPGIPLFQDIHCVAADILPEILRRGGQDAAAHIVVRPEILEPARKQLVQRRAEFPAALPHAGQPVVGVRRRQYSDAVQQFVAVQDNVRFVRPVVNSVPVKI